MDDTNGTFEKNAINELVSYARRMYAVSEQHWDSENARIHTIAALADSVYSFAWPMRDNPASGYGAVTFTVSKNSIAERVTVAKAVADAGVFIEARRAINGDMR